jgi:hypothetical protein
MLLTLSVKQTIVSVGASFVVLVANVINEIIH